MLCSLSSSLVQANENSLKSQNLSIERIFQSPALQGSTKKQLEVSPDGQRITFLQGKTDDYEQLDIWEYDISSGKTQLLFDSNNLQSAAVALSDEEKARRERLRLRGTGIVSYQWAKDGKSLLFPLGGDVFHYPLGTANAKQLLDTKEFETDIKLSPKGGFLSYVREQNLFIQNMKSGQETQLTLDGKGPIKNAMAEFVAQEEMKRMTGYWWSPDEKRIAFIRVDESPVQQVTRSEIYADSIKMITQRYPSAGTNNVTVKLAVLELETKQIDWVDLGEEQDIYLPRVKWMADSQNLTYQLQTRDQQTLNLNSYDVTNKTQKTLLTETSKTWINLHKDLRFLKDKQHFIWASERTGYKHLYLYKNNGELVKPLTHGKWVVEKVTAIDEKKQLVYFSANKDAPIERHLYSVSLTDRKLNKISQGNGSHSISFSQDASVYVDSFSTTNTPQQVSLHKANGDKIIWLNENSISKSHPLYPFQKQWVKPEISSFKTTDGTELFYRLYKPKKLEGKHPVIVYTYGGPGVQVVKNSWQGNRGLLMQYWVSKGYVVFSVDNRGSKYRGHDFEAPLYKEMGEIEVQDQIEGVKFLRKLPYVDPARVGIYGHSYGGYMSLMSMFKAGEYFQAGVAGAPVTDWALYDTFYTERYMGNPKTEKAAYEASSVFPYAKDLKGKLLIYHGMADDNVLFSHSTKLYKHLQDLAIPFESMDYPGKKHGMRGKKTGTHLYKTITNFFDTHFNM